MIQLANLLARPLFGKRSASAAKDKVATVDALLTRGSGETWIPLARQQATLPTKAQVRSQSVRGERGTCAYEKTSLGWKQFDWPEQVADGCTIHKLRWRFYRNGLICLELVASKKSAGFDVADLVGHAIELRDRSDFLIGVWSAAFAIRKGDDHAVFHAAAADDFLPLKLHFANLAEIQCGVGFRI